MFETNQTIMKIDGKNVFVDVQEAFAIGKVCFQFRRYDDSKQKGSRITQQIDAYMSIDDFLYFCFLLRTGRLMRTLQTERQNAANGYPKPGYVLYGGSNKAGQPVISRKIQVECGMKSPYLLSALQGPGRAGEKGQIMPAYKDKDAEKISIPLSEEMAVKLALNGERAIHGYYDVWSATGMLNEKLELLKSFHAGKRKDTFRESADQTHPYNNPPAQEPYGNVTPIHPQQMPPMQQAAGDSSRICYEERY